MIRIMGFNATYNYFFRYQGYITIDSFIVKLVKIYQIVLYLVKQAKTQSQGHDAIIW